jgi:hypothetical protein
VNSRLTHTLTMAIAVSWAMTNFSSVDAGLIAALPPSQPAKPNQKP